MSVTPPLVSFTRDIWFFPPSKLEKTSEEKILNFWSFLDELWCLTFWKITDFPRFMEKRFFSVFLGRKKLLRHKIENNVEIFMIFRISFHYGFEMGNLKYYGILTHMYCFIVYHVKKSHFFRAKNAPLEENSMSPESEPRLMWLPNPKNHPKIDFGQNFKLL